MSKLPDRRRLRSAVEKKLSYTVSEDMWARLVRDRHPPYDTTDINELVAQVRKVDEKQKPLGRDINAATLRREMVARLLELKIRKDRTELFGQPEPPFVDISSMAGWLQREAKELSSRSISAQLTSGFELVYPLPKGGAASIPVAKGTQLHNLLQVATERSRDLGCDLPQAVALIMTGELPNVAPITVTTQMTTLADGKYTGELTLTVREPVTEAVLLKQYQIARQRIWGNIRAPRPPRRRDAQLALFYLDCRLGKYQLPGRGIWSGMLLAWNSKYPKWEFESWQEFRRAAKRASDKAYPSPPVPRKSQR